MYILERVIEETLWSVRGVWYVFDLWGFISWWRAMLKLGVVGSSKKGLECETLFGRVRITERKEGRRE